MFKELEEKVNKNMKLNNPEGKVDIKPIEEDINRILELDHECNKIALNLVIFILKEKEDEDTLVMVKEELHNRLHIETTFLTEENILGKLIENK